MAKEWKVKRQRPRQVCEVRLEQEAPVDNVGGKADLEHDTTAATERRGRIGLRCNWVNSE